jgi:hypothetical protein
VLVFLIERQSHSLKIHVVVLYAKPRLHVGSTKNVRQAMVRIGEKPVPTGQTQLEPGHGVAGISQAHRPDYTVVKVCDIERVFTESPLLLSPDDECLIVFEDDFVIEISELIVFDNLPYIERTTLLTIKLGVPNWQCCAIVVLGK